MKRVFSFVAAFAATFLAVSANAENIAPGATYAQTFDSLGNAGTATLPNGWSATSSASVRSVTSTEWEAAVTATEKQGTGTGTNAGIYNWGDAENESDRGVGFLASGSAAKTGNLYLSLTATGYIPSFTVSYDMKCYRNNSRQYRFQLYYSTDDGTTWTSAGSDFCTSNIVATSGVVLNPAGVTAVSSKTLNVSLASGETVILCWSYSVSSGTQTSNAQGLGIDNVSIVAESSSGPAPLAAPTGLSVSSVTDSGFSLSWTAVADADNYEVEVLAGSTAAGTVSVSGTGATVEGLSADTDYTAKVRALPPAGSTTLLASDWSAPFAVTTELADGLKWGPVFKEEFSGTSATLSWGGNVFLNVEGDVDTARTDMDTWHGKDLYNAPAALRFGNSSKHGWVESPSVSLSNGVSSATVKVTFSAGALAAAAANRMVFSVLDASGDTIEIAGVSPKTLTLPVLSLSGTSPTLAEALAASNALPQSFSFTAPADFKMKFDASQGTANSNIAIDDILVRQIVDPGYAVLPTPTGVAGSDVGKHGFTVSWTGVANATGYEVWLNGAYHGFCASTFTSMSLTGLSDGTTYSVQVRALGDNLHVGDSPLSTAISVTTLADAQKIDFTVTGAPAGDVFAGDAVSFTVTAENESTHAAEPVAFAGGLAGATFSNGTFSWTPAESNVGTNVATFTSGTYSTNVAISVVSAYTTETLATENFSQIKSTSWTSTTGYTNRMDGDIGTWTGHDMVKTKSAVIIGRRTSSGTAVSPAVELKVRTPGSLSVSFDTGSVPDAIASVRAQILDAADDTVLYTTNFPSVASLPAGATAVSDAGVRFTVAPDASVSLPAAVKLEVSTYESSGDTSQRAYVDTVVFAQTVSARLRDLAAPTGLALSGAAGETGFAFGWTAVSGATGYAVRVLDSAGAAAGSATVDSLTAAAAVTNLADDASYTVQVRATGDPALYFDSPWSEPLAVQTGRSALHPTLSFGAWQNAVGDGLLHAGLANEAAVSAALDDTTPVSVVYKGISPEPGVPPTFNDGTVFWRPDDDDTNKVFALSFEMTPAPGVTYVTNVSCTVLTAPPLEPPAITVVSTGVKKASFAWDPEPQFRATGYLVRLWRGSKDYTTPGVCYEDFFDRTMPLGWTATGTPGTDWYKDDDAPVKFEKDGDVFVTKLHSAPVTNLSFKTELHGSAGSSSWTLYASSGGTNSTDWTSLGGGTIGTRVEHFNDLPVSSNYRRFKWVFSKNGGNFGLGQVAAEHAGAGATFVNGYGTAAAAQSVGMAKTLSCDTLRAGKEYFFEVTVTDGTTFRSSLVRFSTRPADKATVMILR